MHVGFLRLAPAVKPPPSAALPTSSGTAGSTLDALSSFAASAVHAAASGSALGRAPASLSLAAAMQAQYDPRQEDVANYGSTLVELIKRMLVRFQVGTRSLLQG